MRFRAGLEVNLPLLKLYYDVVCPFAYVAFIHALRLAEEEGVELELEPILLGGVMKALERPERPMDVMNPNKARLTMLDAMRQADLAGVPLSYHPQHPRRTVAAMRCLHAAPQDKRIALSRALYEAYWVQNLDLADLEVLQTVVGRFGVNAAEVQREPAVRDRLRQATQVAIERGFFGVPTWEIDGWFDYGADRLPFVRQRLGLPPVTGRSADGVPRKLTFFHDFSSPFSYLASTQVKRVSQERGASLEYVPFLLGALFKQIGTPVVPIAAFSEPRRQWAMRDMRRWAEAWDVPLRFPSQFPLRTVTALRVAIVDPRTTDCIYRAAWAEDRDIGKPEILLEVLDGAGFPGAALLEATRRPERKAQLFSNSERAALEGACGAPTLVVDGRHVFWGQDRIEMVEAALSGWQPPGVALPV